ncbi:MAG: DNA polymerase III subunit alpha [Gammaproteobacteria bacterium]|nr:DNA polymerase III subunit alpha [Gammaproteobacteria bacterium]
MSRGSAGEAASAAAPGFVHLRVHSHYSLEDGLLRVAPLVERVAELGMGAVALTEQDNLFSIVKFYRAAQQRGVKPIVGADLRHGDPDAGQAYRVTLLCCSRQGYVKLNRLLTRAYRERGARVLIRRDWLRGESAGLLALSGGREGDVGRCLLAGHGARAREELETWMRLFPNGYYLELQRTGRPGEDEYLEQAVRLAAEFGVPVVATNDVRFLGRDDFEAHEARVCIARGKLLDDRSRERPYSELQYLRSADEMRELFDDLPEALENSVAIAQRCNLELDTEGYHLPEFQVPDGYDQDRWLAREAERGLQEVCNFRPSSPRERADEYRQRLRRELEVIVQMGFSGYFLIVADFIRWAREQGIPVGPGRGSGGGSLVAYALGITELDPIRYDLLFERFLNPERVTLPDFDIDFCMERRDEVIEYVAERYGRERVSQIITYGNMNARAVVRDVGRILGHTYGFVDKIAKCIPGDLNMTLGKALAEESALQDAYEQQEDVRTLIDLARKLEGTVRHAGRHAGGVVITPRPLIEYMPLYCEQGGAGNMLTQFDMNDVETIGLVKFDFLGLRTLTVLDNCLRTVNEMRAGNDEPALRLEQLSLEDSAPYRLIRSGRTAALFQLESEGMKGLIRRLQPERFDDLVALVALIRPGPLKSGMAEDYINRKHGRERVRYMHPSLEPILRNTWGVILYQEQVMEIARVLAGYTLGAADLLRRAMGKKQVAAMAEHSDIFVTRAVQQGGVPRKTAERIFELMETFAGYGFNKSHSVAYALLAYRTAWFKARYPSAFMAALLTTEMDHTDRLVSLCGELRRARLELLPPSINRSGHGFRAMDAKAIRYGLGAVRGVGRGAAREIETERDGNGAFRDLFDLCRRLDARRVNRRALEALSLAGALDDFGVERSVLLASLEGAMQAAEQFGAGHGGGQGSLFAPAGETASGEGAAASLPYAPAAPWDETQRLAGEKQALGQYLSGHPIRRYREECAALLTSDLGNIRPGPLFVIGYVQRVSTRRGSGGRVAYVFLEDADATLVLYLHASQYRRFRGMLAKDSMVAVRGAADRGERERRLKVEQIYDLQRLRDRFASLWLRLGPEYGQGRDPVAGMRELFGTPDAQGSPVWIEYRGRQFESVLRLGDAWRLRLCEELLERLRGALGRDNVRIQYNSRGNGAAPNRDAPKDGPGRAAASGSGRPSQHGSEPPRLGDRQ